MNSIRGDFLITITTCTSVSRALRSLLFFTAIVRISLEKKSRLVSRSPIYLWMSSRDYLLVK